MQDLWSTHTRPVGKTGLRTTLLGFGAAPVGNLYQSVEEQDALSSIRKALALGIAYLDTAPHYGFGLSESRVGSVLAELEPAAKPLLSSKVGRLLVPSQSTAKLRFGFADAPALEPVFDYSYDGVMRSFEASLQRLQVEHIDILFAHDLGQQTHGDSHAACFREFMEGGYRALHDLRAEGSISAIGIGANEWQVGEQAFAHGDFDCFLLAGRYTLLEQSACDTFLPLCAKRGVSVVLGGPFNSGILASGVAGEGPHYYNYAPAPAQIVARVRQLENLCSEYQIPLAAAALQFPTAHPQICSVIAGLASSEQVEQALELMNCVIPNAFWQSLREHEYIHPEAPLPQHQ